MWTRVELKTKAKELLKGVYWKAVLVSFILALITGGGSAGGSSARNNVSQSGSSGSFNFSDPTFLTIMGIAAVVFMIAMIAGLALGIFLFNPLTIGAQKFFVQAEREEDPSLNYLGYAFKNNYGRNILTLFLMGLYIFLWSLLFIIPGIVKAYQYRMVPYILADRPELDQKEVFALSKQMMDGEKWNAFVLDLSFLGWHILGIITAGILEIFYIAPYVNLTNAQLYLTLSGTQETVDKTPEYAYNEA